MICNGVVGRDRIEENPFYFLMFFCSDIQFP